ncbi:hypothetical protein I310_00018 [Cryptococcus deuterogattii CA1014]|nr:hypothetical protein I310_00018 [Cryptococcus deuterogattii CA1014]
MLFEAPNDDTSDSSLPGYIHRLLSTLSSLLSSDTHTLPPHLHHLLFSQPLSRQAIINLYPAGTGITPHIDLVGRYADGVVGCSVIGGARARAKAKARRIKRKDDTTSTSRRDQSTSCPVLRGGTGRTGSKRGQRTLSSGNLDTDLDPTVSLKSKRWRWKQKPS